jgi:transporter family protein
MWWIYALISALFASLTAIFAKICMTGVNSNLATAIRTIIILILALGIVLSKVEEKGIATLSKQNLLFLIISGVATGLSWKFNTVRWAGCEEIYVPKIGLADRLIQYLWEEMNVLN